MMLSGLPTINGVSSGIFGTNAPNYDSSFVTSTTIQAQMKAAGVTVIRASLNSVNGTLYTDAQLDQLLGAITNSGAVMLAILPHAQDAFNKRVVQRFGSRCLLYEYSNEPDLGEISWQSYRDQWISLIPSLRAINPQAAFIGPTLGVFANVDSYLIPWLQACKNANDPRVLPDAISYHVYPCTNNARIPQATCLARAGDIGANGAQLRTKAAAILGYTPAIACTEWNSDAWYNTNGSQGYSTNAPANDAFNHQFAIDALEGFVANKIDMACHFEITYYLENRSGPTSTMAQYTALQAETAKYLSGRIDPDPTPTPIPTPTPSGLTPLSLSYSNMVSAVNPVGNKLLISNSGTPPSAQSYTSIGTQLGFVEIAAQGGMVIASSTMSGPSGRGFFLDPATLSLTGQTIPAGDWKHIIRLNAAQTISHPQAGQLVGDLYVIVAKYNTVTHTYTYIANMVSLHQSLTPNFTNYPMSASHVPSVSFDEGETLYIEQWMNITANANNNPQQGIRFNRLATTAIGDPFGTLVTPGYQVTTQPTPVPVPPTVTLSDTGLAQGTYTGAVIDVTIGNTPTSIPITLTIK